MQMHMAHGHIDERKTKTVRKKNALQKCYWQTKHRYKTKRKNQSHEK